MNVRVVGVTKPLIQNADGTEMTAEQFIVYCARVSNPSNQLNMETAERLLRYCIKHKHWSIFETVSMTVEIETSRAIAAQILRHRSFTFQEFSQRYAVATAFEPVELRKQGVTNRQGGEEPADDVEIVMPLGGTLRAQEAVSMLVELCGHVYKAMVEAGVAKECARMILPLCTQTRLYMTGNVRSWIHYFQVRCDSHAQKEHREGVVKAIRACFDAQFPTIAELVNRPEE